MKKILFVLPLFALACSPSSLKQKPVTLDELMIEVRNTSREIAFTNKQAGFFYTETSAPHRTGWQGWTIMSTMMMSDYQIAVDGHQIKRSDVRRVQVFPHQFRRDYVDGTQETVTLLDSVDALVVELDKLKGTNLTAAPLFSDSQNPGDYLVRYSDGVLLFARKRHLMRSDRENYPVWIGFTVTGGFHVDSSSHSQNRLFAPTTLEFAAHQGRSALIMVAEETEARTAALAKTVAENYPVLIARRRERMERLLQKSFLRVNDEQYEKALAWAKISMDALIMNQVKKGIFAGLPWFSNYWGRDSFISLPGASLVTGNYSEAKEIIRSFAEWQEKNPQSRYFGRIPNLVTTTSISYNTTDGTPLFVNALYEYVNYSGDSAFARTLYPVVRRAIEGSLRYRIDKNIFLTHEDAETWMDAVGPDGPWSPRGNRANDIQALWMKELNIGSLLAHAFHEETNANRWDSLGQIVYNNFQRMFVDTSAGVVFDHLRPDGTPDKQIRPNQLLTLDFIENPETKRLVFRNVTQRLVYPHGIASLSQDDENFHPYHHFEPHYVQDAAYHNGIVWTWLAGPWIQTACELGLPNLAFEVTKNMTHQILERGAVGTLSELVDAVPRPGEKEPRLSGAISQAWSLAEFIRTFYQSYLGISVDAVNRHLWFFPQLPDDITNLAFNIHIGDTELPIEYERSSGGARVTLGPMDTPSPLQLDIGIPVGGNKGRLCRLTLQPKTRIVLSVNEDGFKKESQDSTEVRSSMQPLAAFEDLQDIHLATPIVRPGLNALKDPLHRILSNAEVKLSGIHATLLCDMSDRAGDDNGSGSYLYPLTQSLKPGSLDITYCSVRADDRNTYFMLQFRNLSDPGWHPEYGFQLTFVAIAIDKDGVIASGGSEIGRNAHYSLPKGFGFETIIYIGGGVRVEDDRGIVLAEYVPASGDERNPLGSVANRTIEFSIPTDVLGVPQKSWRYAVIVGAQDDHGGAGIGDFRSVEALATEWTGGGKKRPKDANVYDVLIQK